MATADIAGLLAAGLVGSWILLTVVANLPKADNCLARVVGYRRILSLIPRWSFFAPLPVTSDISLLYRDRLSDGSVSLWRDIERTSQRHVLLRPLWNPGARCAKAISDASNVLISSIRAAKPELQPHDLALSVPYLLLLNAVCAYEHGPGVDARQFALVRHNRRKEGISVVFISGFHRLDTREGSGFDAY